MACQYKVVRPKNYEFEINFIFENDDLCFTHNITSSAIDDYLKNNVCTSIHLIWKRNKKSKFLFAFFIHSQSNLRSPKALFHKTQGFKGFFKKKTTIGKFK